MSAKLIIERESAYAGNLRNHKVVVDGKVIGRVADGQTQSFDIESGDHSVWLKVDWARSAKTPFKVGEGQEVRFKSTSPLKGSRLLLGIVYATILSHRYITLERVTGGSAEL
jgi:hypothetical protein